MYGIYITTIYLSIITYVIWTSSFKQNVSGVHYIFDLDNVSTVVVSDNKRLIHICDDIMKKIQVTVLNKLIHEFQPQGLTLLYLLSESHFSLHTWPEHNKIRMDFFSCQNGTASAPIMQYVDDAFSTFANIRIIKMYR